MDGSGATSGDLSRSDAERGTGVVGERAALRRGRGALCVRAAAGEDDGKRRDSKDSAHLGGTVAGWPIYDLIP